MGILFILSSLFLVVFSILAIYDGIYLHLWKFELFNRKESQFEHLTHTIRALLFPLIVFLLFVNTDQVSFSLGVALVFVDLLILGLDAFSEDESRAFMGGLPKWEYIIHLFANSFHFATFLLIIVTRLHIGEFGVSYSTTFLTSPYLGVVQDLAQLMIPGAILMGLLHLILNFEVGSRWWYKIFKKSLNHKEVI